MQVDQSGHFLESRILNPRALALIPCVLSGGDQPGGRVLARIPAAVWLGSVGMDRLLMTPLTAGRGHASSFVVLAFD